MYRQELKAAQHATESFARTPVHQHVRCGSAAARARSDVEGKLVRLLRAQRVGDRDFHLREAKLECTEHLARVELCDALAAAVDVHRPHLAAAGLCYKIRRGRRRLVQTEVHLSLTFSEWKELAVSVAELESANQKQAA
jgi:hypothetical protein